MYALKLPPELVRRLYHLREVHRLGSIRKQVLIAVADYCTDMEAEYGGSDDVAAAVAPPAPHSRATRHPKGTTR